MKFNISQIKEIKLIVWDLDETFWHGTLSDAGSVVIPIEDNIQLVKYLAGRGVVCAICSKNDKEAAENKLKELDILDYFVFNSINWEPKGQRLNKIIKDMSLRPTNVLFLDDNLSNLAEAEFVLPELKVSLPSIIPDIILSAISLGKDDDKLSRLNQYKVLEKKRVNAEQFSSNEDFLKSSNIRICFDKNPINSVNRIHELILRSNQLNFTKKRCSKEELISIIKDQKYSVGSVTVNDDYGKYGLVGFYAFRDGKLEHFLFSCRTMGMGIEQYVYCRIGCPQLDVIEPISGMVSSNNPIPGYIKEVGALDEDVKHDSRFKMLLKGPCDLQVMASYVESANCAIDLEFNFTDDNGSQEDFYNHSENILNSFRLTHRQVEKLCKDYPFLSPSAFKTNLFHEKYDVVCLSLLMDATLAVYKNEDGVTIPYGLLSKPIVDKDYWEEYKTGNVMTAGSSFFTIDVLEKFAHEFELSLYTAEDVKNNIMSILREVWKLNSQTRIVIILLSELPFLKNTIAQKPLEGKEAVHKEINQLIKSEFAHESNIHLLDVNKYILSQSDYFDNVNHYSKMVYYKMAKELINYVNAVQTDGLSNPSVFKALSDHLKRLVYKVFFVK